MHTHANRLMFIGRMVDKLEDPTAAECRELANQLKELQSDLVDAGLAPEVTEQLLRSVHNYQEYLNLHCPERVSS